jgi:hypothetical protein
VRTLVLYTKTHMKLECSMNRLQFTTGGLKQQVIIELAHGTLCFNDTFHRVGGRTVRQSEHMSTHTHAPLHKKTQDGQTVLHGRVSSFARNVI